MDNIVRISLLRTQCCVYLFPRYERAREKKLWGRDKNEDWTESDETVLRILSSFGIFFFFYYLYFSLYPPLFARFFFSPFFLSFFLLGRRNIHHTSPRRLIWRRKSEAERTTELVGRIQCLREKERGAGMKREDAEAHFVDMAGTGVEYRLDRQRERKREIKKGGQKNRSSNVCTHIF